MKPNVSEEEYEMQKYVYNLNIVNTPKILNYENNIMTMQKIPEDNISNNYGEEAEKVPKELFEKIRKIIKLLDDNNIIYPDITGYNFIEYDNKVWIIDFEHAYFKNKDNDNFVKMFLDGSNMWNDDFV